MSNQVKHLTQTDFDAAVQNGVVLVDFWASWCGPCRMLAPVIDQLAEENAGKAVIAKVDVDEQGELAMRFGVASIPTLLLFKDGQLIDRAVGVKPKTELQALIDRA